MLSSRPVTALTNTAGPPEHPDPHQASAPAATTTRTLYLLDLVRRLITYGRDLSATLQRRPSNDTTLRIGIRFGVVNVAVILARIAHALRLAEALEIKLQNRAARPVPARAADTPRKPRAPRTAPRNTENFALPTVEEIAEQLRHRPVHAVLAEICGNLGLVTADPLWKELHEAVCDLGGDVIALVKELWKRTALQNFLAPDMPYTEAWLLRNYLSAMATPAVAGTGPP